MAFHSDMERCSVCYLILLMFITKEAEHTTVNASKSCHEAAGYLSSRGTPLWTALSASHSPAIIRCIKDVWRIRFRSLTRRLMGHVQVSILGDLQDQMGQSPKQPGLTSQLTPLGVGGWTRQSPDVFWKSGVHYLTVYSLVRATRSRCQGPRSVLRCQNIFKVQHTFSADLSLAVSFNLCSVRFESVLQSTKPKL